MAQKPMTYIVLILLIGGGFLVGSFFGGSLVGSLATPADHRAIVAKMKVTNTISNLELTPICVGYKSISYSKGVSLSTFTVGEDYMQSDWLWKRYDDTELAMTICGPDDTGHMYYLEFGRLGSNMQVTYDGVEKFTIPKFMGEHEGLYWFEVELP